MVRVPGVPAIVPGVPAIVPGRVSHSRRGPKRHRFRYRTYQWLVDLDDLPDHRSLASFRVADHLGDASRSLRENVAAFAAARGEVLESGDRVLMLANARSLGYVFNPLTVFWCLGPAEEPRWVILEVHNTYGERHAYLARPDRFSLRKEFYVSPFFAVNGQYDVTLRLDRDRINVVIDLSQHGSRVFSATFAGRPRPVRRTTLLVAALVPYQVWALIRLHGIWLWLRRLPVVRRTPRSGSGGSGSPRADEIAGLGFDAVFRRMWEFYLAYSEAGFRSGYLGVSQFALVRRQRRNRPWS
ncbi:DUF1365 family protein [Kribbella sp. NPDC049174]|uniref:DUF1365 domain-containing protein n=1 Tax=Kribbella sp. NPDC049174 TaxID=3364112 RepID=UPI00371DF78B